MTGASSRTRSSPLPASDAASEAPRVGFAGTPEFAAVILRHLLAGGYRPALVLTQPDRPAGRGRKLTASAVKALALDEGLTIQQPASLKSADDIARLGLDTLDCLLVAAYGLILPRHVLDAPRIGCINVHASLLPRWRGAAPIAWAIASGDEATGVCLMQMEAGLDTGPVFASQRTPITARDTSVSLQNRLAHFGGSLLVEHMPDLLAGALDARPQDDEQATYARKLSRDDGLLRWQQPARALDCQIRAFNPYPGCVATLDGTPLKCWHSELADGDTDAAPGTILDVEDAGMRVACGEGVLRITEVQRPGRARITPAELANQLTLRGQTLGDGQ